MNTCCNNIYPDEDLKRWETSCSVPYYTKSEIDEIIEDISISGGGITSGEVQTMIDAATEPIEGDITALNGQVEQLSTSLENKADKSEIPSLNGYATEQWVQSQGYLTEHQPIKTINNISLIGEGNIEIGTGGTIDLSDYYNKQETDNLLDEKLDASAYTPTDLSSYWTSAQTQSAITQAVSGKADASNVYNKTEVNNLINNKIICLTQNEYDSLITKQSDTLYLIYEV